MPAIVVGITSISFPTVVQLNSSTITLYKQEEHGNSGCKRKRRKEQTKKRGNGATVKVARLIGCKNVENIDDNMIVCCAEATAAVKTAETRLSAAFCGVTLRTRGLRLIVGHRAERP